jgi:hypothetical protein
MASSESEAMVGMIMMPMTMPADSALKTWMPGKIGLSTTAVMNSRAKKPKTTVGMPASTSSVGLRILRALGLAYSER